MGCVVVWWIDGVWVGFVNVVFSVVLVIVWVVEEVIVLVVEGLVLGEEVGWGVGMVVVEDVEFDLVVMIIGGLVVKIIIIIGFFGVVVFVEGVSDVGVMIGVVESWLFLVVVVRYLVL